jgi:hypothetical protein
MTILRRAVLILTLVATLALGMPAAAGAAAFYPYQGYQTLGACNEGRTDLFYRGVPYSHTLCSRWIGPPYMLLRWRA